MLYGACTSFSERWTILLAAVVEKMGLFWLEKEKYADRMLYHYFSYRYSRLNGPLPETSPCTHVQIKNFFQKLVTK